MPRLSFAKAAHWRRFFVFLIFLIAGGAVISRLFVLQILRYKDYVVLAARQNGTEIELPRRGTIYLKDKDGKLQAAALNKDTYVLSAVPKDIADPEAIAPKLAEVLKVDPAWLANKISLPNDPYEILARKVDDDIANIINGLRFDGIRLEKESRRTYPGGTLAAQVLGFVKFDQDEEQGQYGIERAFNRQLKGETGFLEGITSPSDFITSLSKRIVYPTRDGQDIILTIDPNIQLRIEKALSGLVEKWSAEEGTITVIDPMTGKILAMAGYPAFDANNYGEVEDFSAFLNQTIESQYELGSVMKPVTMAAAINEGLVSASSTYTDTGEVRIKGYTIKNFDGKAHGVQTMANVLEKSLNTGAIFVERLLGHEQFSYYIGRFGFGEKSGIELPGELTGSLSNLETGHEVSFANAAFGQGIAVTPLQMAMAIGAIANGGNLMRPYVVEKIIDGAGVETVTLPTTRRRVIAKETSETISRMLVSVVRSGFANKARINGYFVAGKTGTAQIPDPKGAGYSSEVIHSFVGYAPAFNPRFLIFIQINKPKGVNFATASLTPTFHDLAAYIINYYGIPPDEK
ncbi:MAG: penicillin-binding protein 2 [Candidatus Sungbacteria bacterium]|uniref:Penicillin-binding protein 2 n=1 Tax=Candidatus Sungiibacteriota bacterium TaxID=2750080 RepID=A0A931SD47_9BACT|nr:penicillin-binding protein 2 [Candidatus Sungbacteria bacterium]